MLSPAVTSVADTIPSLLLPAHSARIESFPLTLVVRSVRKVCLEMGGIVGSTAGAPCSAVFSARAAGASAVVAFLEGEWEAVMRVEM